MVSFCHLETRVRSIRTRRGGEGDPLQQGVIDPAHRGAAGPAVGVQVRFQRGGHLVVASGTLDLEAHQAVEAIADLGFGELFAAYAEPLEVFFGQVASAAERVFAEIAEDVGELQRVATVGGELIDGRVLVVAPDADTAEADGGGDAVAVGFQLTLCGDLGEGEVVGLALECLAQDGRVQCVAMEHVGGRRPDRPLDFAAGEGVFGLLLKGSQRDTGVRGGRGVIDGIVGGPHPGVERVDRGALGLAGQLHARVEVSGMGARDLMAVCL